jgi:hypothetical protein
VSWNLADDDGSPLPPTLASLDRLEWGLVAAIMTAWGEARAIPKSTATADRATVRALEPEPQGGGDVPGG